MEPHRIQPESLFPSIASQIRGELGNLHLAASRLAPAENRERDAELDRTAALMDQSYYRLLRLVNILSSAAALAEAHPIPLQNRDLVEFVGEICDRAGDLAASLGVDVSFSCSMVRHVCAINPELLEQLIFHLLSNSLKFTPEGGSVTVELQQQGNRMLLSVTDTGRGISSEHLATLFNRYLHTERQDPSPHGLGLGLSLCRRIAERHGGMLMAESHPDRGSRFTLSLPDRQTESGVSDVPFDYTGGFNRTLLALADALPPKAFLLRNQD